MELLDHRTYYRALQSHDARFDGHVFVGCTSTGIYCRPICPTRPPKFENCRFFASAAAAQEAGFRPCLRCRPEIAPDLAFWRGTANTVSRALALIADGALDGEHSDVEALAGRPVDLTAREWAVLERLLRRPNAIIAKSEIEDSLYEFGAEIESNAVEVYVSRLRKKLGRETIKTIRGVGYKVGG